MAKSYLAMGGKKLEINGDMLRELKNSSLADWGYLFGRALRIAHRHDLGLQFTLNTDTGTVTYLPRTEDKEFVLQEDEAIALAVELHHIFENNRNVYKLPVKLNKGCVAYMFRIGGKADARMVTIILNRYGHYYTSYDPVNKKFFPEVHGLSTKPLDKEYPHMLDELNNMYKRVKEKVQTIRDEADNAQKDESTGGVVGK